MLGNLGRTSCWVGRSVLRASPGAQHAIYLGHPQALVTSPLPRATNEDHKALSSPFQLVKGMGYYLATSILHVLAW